VNVEIDDIRSRLAESAFWQNYLSEAEHPQSRIGMHVAIFAEPFLSFLLDGRKTVESRFSRNRCAPFGEVSDGDIILIKEVAGPICALALARRAWFYDLHLESIDQIRGRYGELICGDEEFWSARGDAAYATLIELSDIACMEPLDLRKRDRRGWVTLRSRQMSLAF